MTKFKDGEFIPLVDSADEFYVVRGHVSPGEFVKAVEWYSEPDTWGEPPPELKHKYASWVPARDSDDWDFTLLEHDEPGRGRFPVTIVRD